jgi:Tol biopolymer transport system component
MVGGVLSLLAAGIMPILSAAPASATVPALNGSIAATKKGDIVILDPLTGTTVDPLGSIYQQDPTWSPDGNSIAYGRGGYLAISTSDGRHTKYFEDAFAGTPGTFDMSPTWNVDGQRIAFLDSHSGIHVFLKDGTESQFGPGASGIAYSPDGTKLAYTDGDLNTLDSSTLSNPQLIVSLAGTEDNPDWSPDGSRLVFQNKDGDNWEIWVVNADGTGATQLTSDPANDVDPSWSPDGQQIIFRSERNGGGLFTMAPDGTGVSMVPGSAKLKRPEWQPQWIGLRASRSVIRAGSTVQLTTQLAWPSENPTVKVQRRKGIDWVTIKTGSVSDVGSLTISLDNITSNTKFRALWDGDSTHGAARSLPIEVDVRTTATGRLLKYYATSGEYRLYHVTKVAWYLGRVVPNLAGERMCFELQRHGTKWRPSAYACFKIRRDGTTLVYVPGRETGSRFRIRVVFDDGKHLPDTSDWSYFRFTS